MDVNIPKLKFAISSTAVKRTIGDSLGKITYENTEKEKTVANNTAE